MVCSFLRALACQAQLRTKVLANRRNVFTALKTISSAYHCQLRCLSLERLVEVVLHALLHGIHHIGHMTFLTIGKGLPVGWKCQPPPLPETKVDMPNVPTSIRSADHKVTYTVFAYRPLQRAEVVQAIRIFNARSKKKPKRGSSVTIITTIGLDD